MTTTAKKHRLQDRLAGLDAHITLQDRRLDELTRENAALRDERDDANRAATNSELQGMRTATELAEARRTLARIDEQHAAALADKDRQIADLHRRLDIGVKAESVVTQTQPIDTATVRMHVARVQHLSALDPHADTVQLPVTDPAHIPGASTRPQEVA